MRARLPRRDPSPAGRWPAGGFRGGTAGRLRAGAADGAAPGSGRGADRPLADPEPAARVAGARGLGATGREDLALLLRLKLRLRDDSSDVMFECMGGALRLDPARSVDLAATFLHDEESDVPEVARRRRASRAWRRPDRRCGAFDRCRRADLRFAILLAAAVLEAGGGGLALVPAVVRPDRGRRVGTGRSKLSRGRERRVACARRRRRAAFGRARTGPGRVVKKARRVRRCDLRVVPRHTAKKTGAANEAAPVGFQQCGSGPLPPDSPRRGIAWRASRTFVSFPSPRYSGGEGQGEGHFRMKQMCPLPPPSPLSTGERG